MQKGDQVYINIQDKEYYTESTYNLINKHSGIIVDIDDSHYSRNDNRKYKVRFFSPIISDLYTYTSFWFNREDLTYL